MILKIFKKNKKIYREVIDCFFILNQILFSKVVSSLKNFVLDELINLFNFFL